MAQSTGEQEPAAASEQPRKEGVGGVLSAAREKRGLAIAEAAEHARVPLHYVQMLEANDYDMVSDRLYLLPFLRRYATFLELDSDLIGMRFVREAVRAENNAARTPVAQLKLNQPAGRNVWITTAVIALFVLAALYLALSGRRRPVSTTAEEPSPAALETNAASGALPPSTIVSGPTISEPGASATASRSTQAHPSSDHPAANRAPSTAPSAAKPVGSSAAGVQAPAAAASASAPAARRSQPPIERPDANEDR